MVVEEARDRAVALTADLVMPAQPGELPIVAPGDAVPARLPVQLAAVGVPGEEVQPASARREPRLRVGHLRFGDPLEGRDAERLLAPVDEPGARPGAAADEDP